MFRSVVLKGFRDSVRPSYLAFLTLAIFGTGLFLGVYGFEGFGVLIGYAFAFRVFFCTAEALYFYLLERA